MQLIFRKYEPRDYNDVIEMGYKQSELKDVTNNNSLFKIARFLGIYSRDLYVAYSTDKKKSHWNHSSQKKSGYKSYWNIILVGYWGWIDAK